MWETVLSFLHLYRAFFFSALSLSLSVSFFFSFSFLYYLVSLTILNLVFTLLSVYLHLLSFSLFIFFLSFHFYLHVLLLHSCSVPSYIFSLSLALSFTSIHVSLLLLYLYLLISSLSRFSYSYLRPPLTPPERHRSRLRFISANERFRDELVLEWEQFRRIRTRQRGRGRGIVKSTAKIAPRDCVRHSESPERSQRAEFMRFVSILCNDTPLRLPLSLLFRPISVFSISPRFTLSRFILLISKERERERDVASKRRLFHSVLKAT